MQTDIVIEELKKAIAGKDDILRKIMICFFAGGHLLLEDMPGVGKTTIAVAFARAFDIDYRRMQFTSDTLPSDVTGFIMYDKERGTFEFKKGPIFTDMFLADEINRTSSKTQSALLEVMEERQVTVDAVTYKIDRPFFVIATQNPYGSAGTNLLPQSQMDRFMMALSIGYPDAESEKQILIDRHHRNPLEDIKAVTRRTNILKIQEYIDTIYVSDEIYDYVIELVRMTRQHQKIAIGGSPRASLALIRLAKARAFCFDRDYVVPGDIVDLFKDALIHRIVLKDHDLSAVSNERSVILDEILLNVKRPSIKGK